MNAFTPSGVRFGPLLSDNGVTFRLWAPAARAVNLVLDRKIAMLKGGDWFVLNVRQAKAGTHYRFEIDGGIEIPDPASHFQPDDVHGPSEVIDHRYEWKCSDWKGRPWHEAVFSEIHVGTFTPEGTFRAAIEKLDHLAATGITALELMPLADFPGRWNWGYDGVLPFAPDSSYGRPEDLKALVDAAHARGLMVFLDVVYNHFGPEGNYLGRIAPRIFSDAQTPWGGAIDFRVPEVRQFAIENALHWLRDYRFDGLRLDAVHAIVTPGEPDILRTLSNVAGTFARTTGRHIHLVLENDDNRTSCSAPDEDPPRGKYRAQWNDDYHHALHALLTGENAGYYRDYRHARAMSRARSPKGCLPGRAVAASEGQAPRRAESASAARPSSISSRTTTRSATARWASGCRCSPRPQRLPRRLPCCCCTPSPPLLFMGDEWGATQPFPFFCDFQGDLAEAVRDGRKKRIRRSLCAAWRGNSRSAFGRDARERRARLGLSRIRRMRNGLRSFVPFWAGNGQSFRCCRKLKAAARRASKMASFARAGWLE